MNNIKTFENFNNQDIFTYIENNDIKSVKNYIDAGYDLNKQDDDSYTVLMYAIIYDKYEIFELLLNAGANINKQNNGGYTALNLAVLKDNYKIVKLLLNAEADIDKQTNDSGDTALINASFYGRIEIVKLLLNAGANIDKQNEDGDTALILAANRNNKKITELLLDYGADEFILNNNNISFYDCLNTKDQQYFLHKYPTSVYNAISHNYKKSFTELVKDYNIKK